jgi:hypothetical protein
MVQDGEKTVRQMPKQQQQQQRMETPGVVSHKKQLLGVRMMQSLLLQTPSKVCQVAANNSSRVQRGTAGGDAKITMVAAAAEVTASGGGLGADGAEAEADRACMGSHTWLQERLKAWGTTRTLVRGSSTTSSSSSSRVTGVVEEVGLPGAALAVETAEGGAWLLLT